MKEKNIAASMSKITPPQDKTPSQWAIGGNSCDDMLTHIKRRNVCGRLRQEQIPLSNLRDF